MEKLEKRKSKYGEYYVDSSLNKYDNVILFPEKLARANEMIAKYGIPDEWKKEQQFWVRGVLAEANAQKNTFIITEKQDDKSTKSKYHIATLSETLNDLVKKYWGSMLMVYIKPISTKGKRPMYELIEVRA